MIQNQLLLLHKIKRETKSVGLQTESVLQERLDILVRYLIFYFEN